MDELAKISRNGTHLVEILTDLAQLSQLSIKSSVIQLHGEVGKMQYINRKVTEYAGQLNAHVPPEAPHWTSGLQEGEWEALTNNTEKIFRIVEAVAANTGWIPHIFHNLIYVETKVNETSAITKHISDLIDDGVSGCNSAQPTAESLAEDPATKDLKAHARNVENIIDKLSAPSSMPNPATMPSFSQSHLPLNMTSRSSLMDKMLGFVYAVNYKVERILPALTRLIGEPGK
jgi:hypothetical protein